MGEVCEVCEGDGVQSEGSLSQPASDVMTRNTQRESNRNVNTTKPDN